MGSGFIGVPLWYAGIARRLFRNQSPARLLRAEADGAGSEREEWRVPTSTA